MAYAGQLRRGRLGEIGDPVDGRQSGTAFQARRERLTQQFRAEGLSQTCRRIQTGRPGGVTTDENRSRLTGSQRHLHR